MSIKTQRIASNIIKELSYILAYEVKDEDIKFVTVTDCKLSPDLSYAKIYVTVFDKNKIDTTMKALKDANGFIRRELSNRVDIRHTPELDFVYDESIEYGKKIEDIIEKIKEEK
ncbi:MAG: 30S ribosome-binding factor RbfA [Firmicutes bacterium]|nr:30S ribosome-binding factor RbfA [Bacillota bacterium]